MPLPCESLNVEVKLIRRAQDGPGGDPGAETTLEDNVPAIIDTRERVQTDTDGTQLVITATFSIDTCDAEADVRDVKKNDWIQWTNYRDRLLRAERIHAVKPVYIGTVVDHLRLEVTGG